MQYSNHSVAPVCVRSNVQSQEDVKSLFKGSPPLNAHMQFGAVPYLDFIASLSRLLRLPHFFKPAKNGHLLSMLLNRFWNSDANAFSLRGPGLNRKKQRPEEQMSQEIFLSENLYHFSLLLLSHLWQYRSRDTNMLIPRWDTAAAYPTNLICPSANASNYNECLSIHAYLPPYYFKKNLSFLAVSPPGMTASATNLLIIPIK